MPVSGSTLPQRRFRFYDGTTPTPYYVEAFQFSTNPVIPIVEPRPTTAIMMDGGKMTDKAITYIEDDSVPFQPIEISFTIAHMSEYLELIDAIGNPRRKGTWTIGAHTWQGLAVSALGTRKNSDDEDIACVAPQDAQQRDRMITIVEKTAARGDAVSGTDFYAEARGFVVTNLEHTEEGQLVYWNFTGHIWGALNSTLTAWPTGNASTPS